MSTHQRRPPSDESLREIVAELSTVPSYQYKGQDVTNEMDLYLSTHDHQYQMWKVDRASGEVSSIKKVLNANPAFLNTSVAEFFNLNRGVLRNPDRTVRQWLQSRLESAELDLSLLFS